MKKTIVVLALALASLHSHAECYSEGVRAGVVQKFSKKGVLNKSWEGELVMGGLKLKGRPAGGVQGGNTWSFSALDPAVAKAVESSMASGDPVALKYCQVLLTWWKTDTPYLVVSVVSQK